MKKFKEVLSETSKSGGGMMPQYGRYAHDTAPAGYSPAVVSKINAIIGRYCIEDLVDPYSAVSKIRGTLSNIGLSFDQVDENAMVESKGSMSFPLTAFGGRFGKDVDTPHDQFLNDDGISHIVEGGLSLHISYEKTDTNQCRLRAHIE